MKNKHLFTYETANVKVKSSEFFCPKRAFFGVWGQGLEKVLIFTAKGTSIRGSTSFEIFCVKIGRRV